MLETFPEDAKGQPIGQYGLLVATMKVPLRQIGKPVPQTSGKVAAGTITIMDEAPQLIVDRIDAPLLGEVEGVIEVTDESMEPTFKKDCRVLNWGTHYYLIDKNWEGMVRRIYPGGVDNSIQLLSDNEDQAKFPPMIMQGEQIEVIFRVKAAILIL